MSFSSASYTLAGTTKAQTWLGIKGTFALFGILHRGCWSSNLHENILNIHVHVEAAILTLEMRCVGAYMYPEVAVCLPGTPRYHTYSVPCTGCWGGSWLVVCPVAAAIVTPGAAPVGGGGGRSPSSSVEAVCCCVSWFPLALARGGDGSSEDPGGRL